MTSSTPFPLARSSRAFASAAPRRLAHWPAATLLHRRGGGRRFGCLLAAQQAGKRGIGGREAPRNPVGHETASVSNAATMNRAAPRVIRQRTAIFPHGGAPC